jgi:hypothetical protein
MTADPPAFPAPPLPRRAIRVAVTGHRDRAGTDVTAVRERVREILAEVRRAVEGTTDAVGLDSTAPPRLVVVSALAAGADQVVAEEALALGYDLHAPLPFLAEAYARDFDDDVEARGRLLDLLARASRVMEVGAERDPASETARAPAYRTVGRLLLGQCDLLVAVWDGEPEKGTGGTGGVVGEAFDAGIPVVVVPPGRPADADLRVCEHGQALCVTSLAALPAVVRRILAPFSEDGASPKAHDAEEVAAAQRRHYAAYLAETAPSGRPAFLRRARAALASAWPAFLRWVGGRRGDGATSVEPGPATSPAVAANLERADLLARHYLRLYRGAFLVNYGLGAAAVSLALAALLAAASGVHAGLVGALPVLEFVAIALVAFLFVRGRTGRWHEKGVNYRVLAELFRQHVHLAPLGLAVPATRPRAHLGGEADLSLSWMAAHFRSVVREEGLVASRFTRERLEEARDALASGWLRHQEAYHRETKEVLGRAERRLEAASLVLFGLTLVACAAHLFVHGAFGFWLSALAAGLPAWAAACHGVVGQAELARLAERSEAMAIQLSLLAARLEGIPGGDLSFRGVAEVAGSAAQAMLHEHDDWQALSRTGDVPLP